MRVNSALKGFFNDRLVVGSGIGIVVLAIFFITSSFTKRSDRDLLAKQANLIVRQIGHRLLLQAGDSTSRVLPVTEIKEGTFLLKFENEFVFNHDSLMLLTHGLLPKTQFPSGYTVTVHECMNGRIVYGFQVNNISPDILPCRGRREPRGCYTIEIGLPDLYANAEQEKAGNVEQEKVENVEQRKGENIKQKKAESLEQRKVENVEQEEAENPPQTDIEQQLIAELKSFKVDRQEANPKPEEFKVATFDYPFIILVCSSMLLLLNVALLIGRFGKSLVPVPVQDQDHTVIQDHAVIKESVPEMPGLGKFLFDMKDQRLLLGSEVISLTDKECRILELLNKNFGELIPRETLMQKVWINEGVITGRSLDMFVSKLRKKLSGDPELRITNVHGKGYKLEIPGIQIL